MTFNEFRALVQNPPYLEGKSVYRIDVRRFKHEPQVTIIQACLRRFELRVLYLKMDYFFTTQRPVLFDPS